MKYIRLLLGSFIIIALLITVISLFIPSHIKLSRATNIGGGKAKVMTLLSEPANWPQWYPGLDSAQPIYDNGRSAGWSFNKKAEIRLAGQTADEVKATFRGGSMRPVVNGWRVISYAHTDSVTVQWYMDFHLRWYPWEKFASLLLEKSYGPQMEQGLTDMKRRAED